MRTDLSEIPWMISWLKHVQFSMMRTASTQPYQLSVLNVEFASILGSLSGLIVDLGKVAALLESVEDTDPDIITVWNEATQYADNDGQNQEKE